MRATGSEEDVHQTAAGPATAPCSVIGQVAPAIDGGRYPIKRTLGEACAVDVDILRDGHEVLAGRITFRGPGDHEWRHAPLTYDYGRDRWHGAFLPDRVGRWTSVIEAWTDRFATWRHALATRVDAGLDVTLDLLEGTGILTEAAEHATGDVRATLTRVATNLACRELPAPERAALALHDDLQDLVVTHVEPRDRTRHAPTYTVIVDRERARFAAWYEMFPRSLGPEPGRPGTFRDAAERLPAIAALGFDVVYLPPIHPIGHLHRKGPNGATIAGPDDPGSPWAIGSAAGGHTAVEPALGTLSPLYGIYSGYELCEATPLHPGSEEYLDSEKFQLRHRDWSTPGNLNDDLRTLNGIRRAHRALQLADNLDLHDAGHEHILWYAKRGDAPHTTLMIVVNLDPHHTHGTMVDVPLELLALDETTPFAVEDLLSGEHYTWQGRRNYIRLDPAARVGQIFRLRTPSEPV